MGRNLAPSGPLRGGAEVRVAAVVCAAGAVAALWSRPRRVEFGLPSRHVLFPGFMGFGAGWIMAFASGVSRVWVLAAGVGGALVPGVWRHRARERESRREAARWPDFLAAVRSRLATGAAIPSAVADAARHVGGRFADLATPPGIPFSAAIAMARRRWGDPLADRVLTTLELANAVGGSQVGAVLGALASSVSEDLRLRRAHDAALTEQRLTAGVALCAPWVILAISVATNPASAQAFATPTGNLIVTAGVIATGLGYALARRSARLSRPPRLFA